MFDSNDIFYTDLSFYILHLVEGLYNDCTHLFVLLVCCIPEPIIPYKTDQYSKRNKTNLSIQIYPVLSLIK